MDQRDGTSEDTFVQMREARDTTLSMPRLIVPSLQGQHSRRTPA